MVLVRKSYHADCCFQRDKMLTSKVGRVTNNKSHNLLLDKLFILCMLWRDRYSVSRFLTVLILLKLVELSHQRF